MSSKRINFENTAWDQTPYKGVFVSCIDEYRPGDSKIPIVTAHAVRIDPLCEVGLHYHDREAGWTEVIVFPRGGNFEFCRSGRRIPYSGPESVYERINTKEVYGIINKCQEPLFLLSIMKPGFTGYQEIRNI